MTYNFSSSSQGISHKEIASQTNTGYLFIECVFTVEDDFHECECIVVHADCLLLIGVLIHGDDYP